MDGPSPRGPWGEPMRIAARKRQTTVKLRAIPFPIPTSV